MDIVSIILIIAGLITIYFFFGVLLKFVWGWLPLAIGSFIALGLIITGGGANAIGAIIIFFSSLLLTNKWQGSNIYFIVEEKIEKLFYFND